MAWYILSVHHPQTTTNTQMDSFISLQSLLITNLITTLILILVVFSVIGFWVRRRIEAVRCELKMKNDYAKESLSFPSIETRSQTKTKELQNTGTKPQIFETDSISSVLSASRIDFISKSSLDRKVFSASTTFKNSTSGLKDLI